MATNTTQTTGNPLNLSDVQYNGLIQLGFLAQAIGPYHNTTMTETVDLLLAPNSTVNLTQLLGPVVAQSGTGYTPAIALTALKLVLNEVPHDNVSFNNVTAYVVMSAVTLAFVLIRLYSRRFVTKKIRPEDWAMIPATIVAIMLGACFALGSDVRVGHGTSHIWDLTFDQFKVYLEWLFVSEIFYPVALYLVRNSLLIFYWCLVPPRSSSGRSHIIFRNTVLAFFGVNFACLAVSLGTIIFQCKPIAYWNDPIFAKCIDRTASFVAGGVLIVITDVMVLVLPIPIIWQLNLPTRSKLGVIGIFSLGLFACVASVNRIILAKEVTDSGAGDITYVNATNGSGIWSLLEVDIAIIASCVPAIKAMFVASERNGTQKSRTERSGRSARTDEESGKLPNGKRAVIRKDGAVELTVTTSVTVTTNAKDDVCTVIETDEEASDFVHYSRPFRADSEYGHDYDISYGGSDSDSKSSRTLEHSPSEYHPENHTDHRWTVRNDSIRHKAPSFI